MPKFTRITPIVLISILAPQGTLADSVAPPPILSPDLNSATSELVRVAEATLEALNDRIANGQTHFEVTQDQVLETMGISKSDEEALLASNEAFFHIKKKSRLKAILTGAFLRAELAGALHEVGALKETEAGAHMPRALNRLLTFVLVAGSTMAGVIYLQPWVIAAIPGVLAVGPIYVAGAIGFVGGCILGSIFQTIFRSE
ncbi:MAG: hypothetical protein KGP28_02330 [Bdellovibrionales bacterium]|nr:hypothetical protein [Bdellovibrionales bacterium]